MGVAVTYVHERPYPRFAIRTCRHRMFVFTDDAADSDLSVRGRSMTGGDVTRVVMATVGLRGPRLARAAAPARYRRRRQCGGAVGGARMAVRPAGLSALLVLVLAVGAARPAALYPASLQLQLPQLYSQLDGVLDSMVSGAALPYGAGRRPTGLEAGGGGRLMVGPPACCTSIRRKSVSRATSIDYRRSARVSVFHSPSFSAKCFRFSVSLILGTTEVCNN